MLRRVSLLALIVCAVSACGTALAGEAKPELVIEVAQRTSGGLEVTPLVLLDPAPVYQQSRYDEPQDGTRLAAVQLKVTNNGVDDQLIGPTGTVLFRGSDGKRYLDSLLHTSAGPMFDQLRLAPGETMVGYATAEIPEDKTVDAVLFSYGYRPSEETLVWQAAGQAVKDAPKTPARKGDKATVHRMGEQVEITGHAVVGQSEGAEVSLKLAATKVIDPAEPTKDVRPGPDRRLVGVEFVVDNVGKAPYDDIDSDADLRIFALHDEADEFVTSHVYGATEEHGMPLSPGDADTWTVLFEVPTDFVMDRISFSPSFGNKVATVWATN
jgi:hypothetical protein